MPGSLRGDSILNFDWIWNSFPVKTPVSSRAMAMSLPFDQTFAGHDLLIIGLLVILEGALSIDNALVLGLLARRLPKSLQGRALTYGLIGAFVFRLIAIATATYLLKWSIVKLLGGG